VDALRGRFGKYHVLDKIAQGGMAEIYKVKTVGLAGFEKIQALKRILPSAAQQGRFIRSFIDEARIAVELSHRNIVQVFDFGKAEGDLYLAMELIEGQDLRSAMTNSTARNVRCPLPVAAYIISEVAAGLDYAHRKVDAAGRSLGIVHCDMSPSNVMLSTDGYVKILDFGIARASFSSALERRRLRGKPRYMAPEQTRGDVPTATTDVFALGIIAWELLSGRALFGGTTLRDILHEVRTFEVPHLRDEVPSVPGEMADAIALALLRDPAVRGTAADLGAACIRSALASGPRGVATWQEEIDQRGSSPGIGRDAAERASRLRRERGPHRPSAISIELRPGELGDGGDGGEPPTERAAIAPLHSDTEAQFPWDDPVAAAAAAAAANDERRTARIKVPRPSTADPVSAVSAVSAAAAASLLPLQRPARPDTQGGAGNVMASTSGATRATASIASRPARASTAPGVAAPAAAPGAAPFGSDAVSLEEAAMASLMSGAPSSAPLPGVTIELPEELMASLDREEAQRTEAAASSDAAPALATARLPDATPPAGAPAAGWTAGAGGAGALDGDPAQRLWGFDVRSFDSESAHDEAIDDRPGEFDIDAVATLIDRRRIVVVVAILDGGAADTLRALARGLGDLAYQRGGVALALAERGVTLAFGLEVPGEDDVAVAMTWAIAASTMVRESAADSMAPQLRVGGRAGVIATIAPEGPPQIGADAIDEARTLARQAQPDRPLFTGGAGRLSSAMFSLREVTTKRGAGGAGGPGGASGAGGAGGPGVRAIEVIGLRPVDERDSALLERRGRFVGRVRELAILHSARQRAIAEHRRVVAVISGGSGVGKSRLSAELVAQVLAASPQTVLMVTSAGPDTRQSPFCLVLDFLQAVLHLPPQRGRAARDKLGRRLLRVLRRGDLEPGVIKAVIGDLERAMELRDGIGVGEPDLADLRNRVGAALTVVRRCLRALRMAAMPDEAEHLTALVIFENLHHADASSLESMRLAIAHRDEGSELFVITTEGPPPPWPFLDEELELRDLVGGELRALTVDRLGESATALNVAGVIGRAGGTPLFVEELAAAVRLDGNELPGTAHDVVAARVDRLSPAARTAVRYAAVLGETVRARLLEEVIPTSQGDIGAALEELVSDGLLERRDAAAPESPEGELRFTRGLFREVVYDSLPPRTRQETHARLGRLLVARFFAGREEPPAMIAEHLEQGGELAAAAAFWLRAGRIALSAADAEAAGRHFTRCLELEARLGEPPPSPPSRVRRREALLGREEAQRLLGQLQTGDADLTALEALCQEQPRRLADLANRRAQRQLRRGDHAGALTATLRAEQLARAASDERLRAEALRLRGEVYEVQGQFDQALSFVAQAGTIFRRHGFLTDEIAAMVGTGRIHLLRAHYEAARDSYRPVIDSLQKSSDPWLERIVRNHLAVIEMCLGNFSEAMALAQRSIDLCRRYGDRAREGDALSVMALILSKIGLYETAATTFSSALDILGATASRWSRTDCLIAAGSCDVRRGLRDGLLKLDEAVAEARQLGARYLEANGLVARAGARLRLGEANAAMEDAEAGAVLARRATLVGCEIQGLAGQAAALYQLGELGRAAPLATRALSLLDVQGHLEGSEEEVLQACGVVLCAAGDSGLGTQALSRARAAVSRKLSALTDPSWRAAYAAILEHRQLLREN
jgi:serine/threonine protein kinase/predicted ATPase